MRQAVKHAGRCRKQRQAGTHEGVQAVRLAVTDRQRAKQAGTGKKSRQAGRGRPASRQPEAGTQEQARKRRQAVSVVQQGGRYVWRQSFRQASTVE